MHWFEQWFLLCSVVMAVFVFLEKTAKEGARAKYVATICPSKSCTGESESVGLPLSIASAAIGTFDFVFRCRAIRGTPGVVRPSYFRSLVVSASFLLVCLIVWYWLKPTGVSVEVYCPDFRIVWYWLTSRDGWVEAYRLNFTIPVGVIFSDNGAQTLSGFPLTMAVSLAVLVNFLGDYVSLFESRYLLGMAHSKRINISTILILDLVLSLFLFSVVAVLALMLSHWIVPFPDASWIAFPYDSDLLVKKSRDNFLISLLVEALRVIWALLQAIKGHVDSISYMYLLGFCFLITSLITSIWIWLYVLTVVIGKVVYIVPFIRDFADDYLKLREMPFIVTGGLLLLPFSIVYFLILLLTN